MKRFLFLLLAGFGALNVAAQNTLPMDDAVFFVETDVGNGVAFLMEGSTGGVWMVSNNSIFQGSRKYKIANVSGVEISFPDQVLVAADRDLIMFPTDRPAGLPRAASGGFEEKLLVFSQFIKKDENDEVENLEESLDELKDTRANIVSVKSKIGNPMYRVRWTKDELNDAIERTDEEIAEVKKEIKVWRDEVKARNGARKEGQKLGKGFLLHGEVVAPGPARIEISALINQRDRGGPVVNKEYEVVGISSYLTKGSGLPDVNTALPKPPGPPGTG
jgi:hypothetical protein